MPAETLTDQATPVALKRLVAVVVTYNRLEKLKVTLARLLESPVGELAAVVVINNASTDGTGDWLDSFAADCCAQGETRLDVINSAVNTGGAGGFATGMRRAMEHHTPDWLVVMDDDGRPEPGALARFQGIPDTKWDGIAAAVYFPDGQICEMNRPSRNPFWHGKEFLRTALKGRSGFHLKSTHYQGDAIAIDVTSFVGFFVSARAVRAQGYPDPDLFIYGDDGIYTIELTQAGHRIGFEPDIRFEHDMATFKVGDDEGAQRGRFVPLWKVYYYHRNLLMLYRIAAGGWFWLAMMAIIPKWLLKTRAHKGEQRVFLRLLGLAIRDGLAGRRHRDHTQIMDIASGRR